MTTPLAPGARGALAFELPITITGYYFVRIGGDTSGVLEACVDHPAAWR